MCRDQSSRHTPCAVTKVVGTLRVPATFPNSEKNFVFPITNRNLTTIACIRDVVGLRRLVDGATDVR